MEKPLKILAIQFKSLGDAVLLIPSLEAIRRQHPDCELHAFVSAAAAPLLQHQPCLNRVWSIPRARGKANLKVNLPVIRALRAERFDRSVDFGGNDRGALLSFVCGARTRLGIVAPGGPLLRRLFFNQRVGPIPNNQPEALRSMAILKPWSITPELPGQIRIYADPALDDAAAQLVPDGSIVCHMGAGRANRQWPVSHWMAFYKMAVAAGFRFVFTPGENGREQALVTQLKTSYPDAIVLPASMNLPLFLAVIKRARALIAGDTGPMHLGAALGLPVIGLFGPSNPAQWAPVTPRSRILVGNPCTCATHLHICESANPCTGGTSPEKVLENLQALLPTA